MALEPTVARQTIRVDMDEQGAAWLWLDRPKVHNAFDDVLIDEMTGVLRALDADPAVRAVAVAATGDSFSAGADLRWMRRVAEFSFDENVDDALRLAELLRVLNTLGKPTVAVVQGPAYGGGVGLVAACDIAVAARERATFALTEVRLGLVPGTISPYVIAAIGARQARRWFLTAERFDAETAMRIGLVHLTVPAEELTATVRRLLADLGAGGVEAIARCKAMIAEVSGRPVDASLMRDTAEYIARARASDEGRARVAAFLEKRAAGR
jgi:methylglutaconyl-CoA hydratase